MLALDEAFNIQSSDQSVQSSKWMVERDFRLEQVFLSSTPRPERHCGPIRPSEMFNGVSLPGNKAAGAPSWSLTSL